MSAVLVTVGASIVAYLGGFLTALGAFPYASGPVPRGALIFCGSVLLATAVVAVVVWT